MKAQVSILSDQPFSDFLKHALLLSNQQQKKFFQGTTYSNKRSLRKGDVVDLPLDFVNAHGYTPVYTGPEIEILHQDQDFLVLNKPAGVHGHSLVYSDGNNCLSFLRQRGYFEVLAIDLMRRERGMIYRLDQVTSGVLVFARNAICFQKFRQSFQGLVKEKTYLAVVQGEFQSEGRHQLYYQSSGPKGNFVTAKLSGPGDVGEFNLKLKRLSSPLDGGHYSLVEVQLKEGLRHQIRSGLASLGHPIVGDELYGASPAERVYLHAHSYNFDGIRFEAPLDLVFRNFLHLNSLL